MSHTTTRKMARCALFAALLSICSWLTIPLPEISITMQTFGVFLTMGLLGGGWGTVACLIWMLLGAAGLPVFSGFRGGFGVLLGPTGGYILGFLAACLIYWAVTAGLGKKYRWLAMVLGLLCCYAFGTLWYMFAYLGSSEVTIWAVLAKCVVPFVLPDLAKLYLADFLTRRLERFVQ